MIYRGVCFLVYRLLRRSILAECFSREKGERVTQQPSLAQEQARHQLLLPRWGQRRSRHPRQARLLMRSRESVLVVSEGIWRKGIDTYEVVSEELHY